MNRIATLAAASALALTLAACEEGDRARIDAPEPTPLAELTTEEIDLPYADPAPVEVYAPDQGYRWAERAYGLQRAVYDTPPDYGFAYDGIEPMVWETEDDWAMYAEPWGGSYRYYYYEPGAAYPYFVRDADYGYAFSAAGILIALFDSGGRYLPAYEVREYAPLAGRYYVRGRDLRNAGLQSRRIRVSEEVWSVQEPRFRRTADPWLRAAREERNWRTWRERNRDRELARFEAEARRRQDEAQGWRERMDRREVAAVERRTEAVRIARAEDRRERQAAQAGRRDRAEAVDRRRESQERLQRAAQAQSLKAERRREIQAQRQQAQAEQRRQAQRQQAQAERRREVQAQRQQAQVDQRRQAQRQQAQAEQRRQAQAQRQQAQAEQRRQVQAERQQAQSEQRRQAQAQRQQAQAEQQRQARAAQRRQAQAERQAQRQLARAAAEQGRPAAARERGEGKGREKDRRE